MKITTVTLLLFMPVVAVAQNYPGMSTSGMQKIQEMQSCIENVDQKQLQDMEQRQNQFDTDVHTLCGNGKRDEAQAKALSFVKEISNNPALQAMMKCGEIAKGMMPDMPFMDQDAGSSNQHICDSL